MLIFMSQKINYLRLHRKRSPLSQSDIAYLAGNHLSNISRWEKGQREPRIEFLLIYHLLFDTSIEIFFEPRLEAIKPRLTNQIRQLITEIKKKENIPRNGPVISFLDQTLIRLTK
ncbi:MAG: XRE family transcriptional regulator [Bacteroidetes bacterium]|nr:MAG: XRE family transcriptional regulator [Bacteroidota bacterium]